MQGVWKPSKIANPDYFEDKTPLNNLGDIGAVAVEIWTMDQGYFFDNVVVANEASKAAEYRTKYWQPKHELEVVCCCSLLQAQCHCVTCHGRCIKLPVVNKKPRCKTCHQF